MFVNLLRGNRLARWLGAAEAEFNQVGGKGRDYLELPAIGFLNDGGVDSEAKRNQTLELTTGITIEPSIGKALVIWNPALLSQMQAPSITLVEQAELTEVKTWVTLRKDTKIEELPWVARVYLLADYN